MFSKPKIYKVGYYDVTAVAENGDSEFDKTETFRVALKKESTEGEIHNMVSDVCKNIKHIKSITRIRQ